MRTQTQRTRAITRCVAVLLLAFTIGGCVEFNTDGPYICRSQAECGDDGLYECRRGAECYCICAEIGTQDPQFEEALLRCEDPNCLQVVTQ